VLPYVNPSNTETTLRDVEAAARAIGLQIQVFNASTSREIDAAFANLVRERPDALFVGGDPFFNSRRIQLAFWRRATRFPPPMHSVTIPRPGLMSYGTNVSDAWRQVGDYTAASFH
jgi:putative ABC transport system substrate-binding protein